MCRSFTWAVVCTCTSGIEPLHLNRDFGTPNCVLLLRSLLGDLRFDKFNMTEDIYMRECLPVCELPTWTTHGSMDRYEHGFY